MQAHKLIIITAFIFSCCYAQQFNGVDHVIEQAIENSVFPGATVIIGSRSKIHYHQAYGHFTYNAASTVVDTNSMFDMASCTKVFATTSCIMKLVDSGLVDIEEYAATYIPGFGVNGKDDIRIKDLLLHESGLAAYYSPSSSQTPEQIINTIFGMGQSYSIGTYVYSCLNFVTLMKVVEAIAGKPMYQFYQEQYTIPLEMTRTMFAPPDSLWSQCLPTSSASGYQGIVHDPLARGLDGYSGNAGLFATSGDLAKICQLLLNNGVFKDIHYLDSTTVKLFTTRYDPNGTSRTLGWGTNAYGGTSAGSLLSVEAYGHTGYTGTSVWCDPEMDIFIILLTNRVYPDDSASVTAARQAVADAAVRAMEGIPPQPILNSIMRQPDEQLAVSWDPDITMGPVDTTELWLDNGTGFQLYDSFTNEITSCLIPLSQAPVDSLVTVRLVNCYDGQTSDNSDTYAQRGTNPDLLIVDGYDRVGSWGAAAHHFSVIHGQALPDTINFVSCDNDHLLSGDVNLNAYPYVVWILADESTSYETFSDAEQYLVEMYLEQGGFLFVSGSEIGWDLGRSTQSFSDRTFYNKYLHATYAGDDAANTTVTGVSGTTFDGLSFQYGNSSALYIEDYPDFIGTANGSSVGLKYGNGYNAAVYYTGTFGTSTIPGKVVYFGFPFETIVGSAKQAAVMESVIEYFQQPTVRIDNSETATRPGEFALYQNYPNPFNPVTNISYQLSQDCEVDLSIYNLQGQKITSLVTGRQPAGTYELTWDASRKAAGIYLYRLTTSLGLHESRKLILLK